LQGLEGGDPDGPGLPLCALFHARGEKASGRSGDYDRGHEVGHGEELRARGTSADRGALTLSGALLLVGFIVNAIQRMIWHPTGEEDDHEAIFREYAASEAWVATHLAEFVLVLAAFAGLLVLGRALRLETPYLALLAGGAIIATGATWAVLQAVDGVTLKQAIDAWVAASGTEDETRFADAETARWIERGLQSYFRVLLGAALLLLGAAAVVSRLVPSWLGVLLVVGGLLSLAVGSPSRTPVWRAASRTPWASPSSSSSSSSSSARSSSPAEPESRAPARLAPRDSRRFEAADGHSPIAIATEESQWSGLTSYPLPHCPGEARARPTTARTTARRPERARGRPRGGLPLAHEKRVSRPCIRAERGCRGRGRDASVEGMQEPRDA
jgi:hypothetical protein